MLGRQGAYDYSMRAQALTYGGNFICRHCGGAVPRKLGGQIIETEACCEYERTFVLKVA
jgi:hypothetical protein